MSKSAFGLFPLRGAFVTWASTDLDAAWAWLEENMVIPSNRNVIAEEAFGEIIAYQRKGVAMMERVDVIEDVAFRREMRLAVLRTWVRHGPPMDILRSTQALPDNDSECPDRIAETIPNGFAGKEKNGFFGRYGGSRRNRSAAFGSGWDWSGTGQIILSAELTIFQPNFVFAFEEEQSDTEWNGKPTRECALARRK